MTLLEPLCIQGIVRQAGFRQESERKLTICLTTVRRRQAIDTAQCGKPKTPHCDAQTDSDHNAPPWVDSPAMRAGAQRFAGIERIEQRWQIVDDAFQLHFNAMHQAVALGAIPFEAVLDAFGAAAFDHQAS